jgi:hypothetical protein
MSDGHDQSHHHSSDRDELQVRDHHGVLQRAVAETHYRWNGTVVPKADNNTRSAALTTNLGRVTTVGTASTVYGDWDWNIVIPFDEVHGKTAMEIEIPAATRFSFFLNGQMAGTRVFDGYIEFEER